MQILHKRLSEFDLLECFPVEVSGKLFTLGISIPFNAMDDPRFESQLQGIMSFLISEQGFQVTDLYTGNALAAGDIPELARRISK